MKPETKWRLADLSVDLLAALLVGMAALLLLLGASRYRQDADAVDADRRLSTVADYVVARARQCDAAGGLSVGGVQGTPCLSSGLDGCAYALYWHDGRLMELFAYPEDIDGFSPGNGRPVAELDSFAFSLEDGLLEVRLGWKGRERVVRTYLRTERSMCQ